MKSIYRFLIKPKGERYNNKIKLCNKEFIVNTKIETFQSVNKKAIVQVVPEAFKTNIQKGDEVIVHHNIFRRYYDMKGREKNGSCFFKDDLYFCDIEQIYLYKKNNNWITNLNYCFAYPVLNNDSFSTLKEQELLGIVKYSNNSLEAKGINPGALITFTPNSEFEFIIDGERLYCMKSNDIALTHEYQEDKVKYNPSWAQSR